MAIDPTHRGFGFAVLEGPDRLVDWGVVYVRKRKHTECLRRMERLIDTHAPSIVVTEDVAVSNSRRGRRTKKLIAAVSGLARRRNLRSVAVSKAKIRRAIELAVSTTKYDTAIAVAERFPELSPILPRRRKCYMSEDERMAALDAIALSIALPIPVTEATTTKTPDAKCVRG